MRVRPNSVDIAELARSLNITSGNLRAIMNPKTPPRSANAVGRFAMARTLAYLAGIAGYKTRAAARAAIKRDIERILPTKAQYIKRRKKLGNLGSEEQKMLAKYTGATDDAWAVYRKRRRKTIFPCLFSRGAEELSDTFIEPYHNKKQRAKIAGFSTPQQQQQILKIRLERWGAIGYRFWQAATIFNPKQKTKGVPKAKREKKKRTEPGEYARDTSSGNGNFTAEVAHRFLGGSKKWDSQIKRAFEKQQKQIDGEIAACIAFGKLTK